MRMVDLFYWGMQAMQEISGSLNKPVMDAYEIHGEQVDVPEGINDFYITIIGELGYVETRQK